MVDAWITSSCVVNHNTQQVKPRQWWWGERNKFKMRLSAHGERKRRLFIHGLNLKLRWHREERTICAAVAAASFWEGCRTHMKSLFLPKWAHPTDLIWYKTKKTWKCKYNKHNSWSLWCAHQQHSSVLDCVWTWLGIFCGCYMGFEKWSRAVERRRKGKLWKCPIVPYNFCTAFTKLKLCLYLQWFHHHKQFYFEVNLPTLLLSNQERFRLNTCCVVGQQQLCKIFWYYSFIVAHTIQGQQKLAKKSTHSLL